jgi:hypothetical protein
MNYPSCDHSSPANGSLVTAHMHLRRCSPPGDTKGSGTLAHRWCSLSDDTKGSGAWVRPCDASFAQSFARGDKLGHNDETN